MPSATTYVKQAHNGKQWQDRQQDAQLASWFAGQPEPGVAAAILQNQNSIGPLEIAYALQNPGAIYDGNVQNAAGVATGTFVTPSVATAQAHLPREQLRCQQAKRDAWEPVSIIDNIYNNASATNAYPITTMTYALLYQNQDYAGFSAAQAAATVNFLHSVYP